MKRTGYLYEKIMTPENIRDAWDAYNQNRPSWLRREYNLALAQKILEGMRSDFVSVIGHPDARDRIESGKIRKIQVPPFQSVIAQLAIWNVCGPYVENRIPDQSFASRPGKGGLLAAQKAAKFVHTHANGDAKYCLQFDIRHFYQHIERRIVMDRLSRIFKDAKVLEMFHVILESSDEGLPIGYPFSHALANLYLSPMYFLMMSERGVSKIYIHMDNWTVFAAHKAALHRAQKLAVNWLRGVGCWLKGDWQIFPISARGAKIGGCVITEHGMRLYRPTWHRLMRNVDKYRARPTAALHRSLMSRHGLAMAARCENDDVFVNDDGRYVWQT